MCIIPSRLEYHSSFLASWPPYFHPVLHSPLHTQSLPLTKVSGNLSKTQMRYHLAFFINE